VPGAGLHADGHTGRARMVVDEDQGYLLGAAPVPPSVNVKLAVIEGGPHLIPWTRANQVNTALPGFLRG
jgi:hypothetical protein